MILKIAMLAEKMNFLRALREMDKRLSAEDTPLKSPELNLEDVNEYCNQNVDRLCSAIQRIEEGNKCLGLDAVGWITGCIGANYYNNYAIPNVCALITRKFRKRIETVCKSEIRFDGLDWNSARRVFSFEFFRPDQNLSIIIYSCHNYYQQIEVSINVRKLRDKNRDLMDGW